MSTEQTWHGLERPAEGARSWVERPGTETPQLPEPIGSRPVAGDGRLQDSALRPDAAVGEATLSTNLAPEDNPAFISFVETFCRGDRICLKRLLDTIERLIIIRALNRSRGNQRSAAVHLGLKYTTLNEKVKKHGLRYSRSVQSVKTWFER